MAVAGLHNISPFRPSLFGPDRAGPSTRASSLLQMWREIEGDQMLSPSPRLRPQMNGSDCESIRSSTSYGGDEPENNEDSHSVISEQSSDLGEPERERVRQIFREWMNGRSINGSNGPGPQRLEKSSQQRNGQGSCEAGVAEPGGAMRRPIKRLCGRQTLVDLLLRAKCETKGEIQRIIEQRPVSDFPHRNRIQALLRGRFLRNERSITDTDMRPSSVAATELGLLRQRQTVSDLREGFLSKLDHCSSMSVHNSESDSSSTDDSNDDSDSTSIERDENNQILTSADVDMMSQQELIVQVTTEVEVSPEVLDNETSDHINTIITTTNEPSIETEYIVGPVEVLHEDYEMRSDESYSTDMDGNENEEFEEPVIEIGNWRENPDNQWLLETSGNDDVERDHMHESREDSWQSHVLEEAIDSWLHMPSEEVEPSVARVDTYYFPDDGDDDNAHNMELRELFSRRRVSSLLGSGFRESLNQVLQSHVERLGHVSSDWEMDNIEHDQQPLNGYYHHQALPLSDVAERSRLSNFVTENEPLWDEEFQESNLPRNNLNQHFGTEWEVINEMRINMARLQQRLNNMQSMVEACMDMQLDLQRSIRQEVSAALNRTTTTRNSDGLKGNDTLHDESKWDHVKKGICCLCSDSKINSLLYRCGHMCTCSKCAEKLVQGNGKCPMCRAPVVEAVRAYFTQ